MKTADEYMEMAADQIMEKISDALYNKSTGRATYYINELIKLRIKQAQDEKDPAK